MFENARSFARAKNGRALILRGLTPVLTLAMLAGFVTGCGGGDVSDESAQVLAESRSCDAIPSWQCVGADCGEVQPFSPLKGPGYAVAQMPYHYVRKDLMMLVKYAAAKTQCMTANFPGVGGPLGIGDISGSDGKTPHEDGILRHPRTSHDDGRNADIAYFRSDARSDYLSNVCNSRLNGIERNKCVGSPHSLDVGRTAVFIALLHDSPDLQVIGLDLQIMPLIKQQIASFCADGTLKGAACKQPLRLVAGDSWEYFHHHHFHMRMTQRLPKPLAVGGRRSLVDHESSAAISEPLASPGLQLTENVDDSTWPPSP